MRRPPAPQPAPDRTRQPPRPGPADDADREPETRKQRRARRAAAGLACTGPVEFDSVMLQFLLDRVSMDDGSDYSDDPEKIGKAISAWWREAAYANK